MPDRSRFARLLPDSECHIPGYSVRCLRTGLRSHRSPYGRGLRAPRFVRPEKPIRRTAPDPGASTATTLTTGLPAREMMNGSPSAAASTRRESFLLASFMLTVRMTYLCQTGSTRQSPWNPPSFAVSAHEIPGSPHLFHPTTACRDHGTPPRFEARQAPSLARLRRISRSLANSAA